MAPLTPTRARLMWVDLIKGCALVWIVLNHVVERIFGDPLIANPSAVWPPLAERLAQLRPLQGHGFWDLPLNLVRYAGWAGDQGVQLFIICSGFVLTWGLLNRQGTAPLALGEFYAARALRIYPLWWGVHLAFLVASLFAAKGLRLDDPAFYASMAGVRVTPALLYYGAPAWWYIGVLIQLYLIYPLLWEGLRRRGPLWLLTVTCAIAFAVRAGGLLFFHGYLDAWARGAICTTRLPEFAFGVSLGAWFHGDPERADRALRAVPALLGGLLSYAAGTALSLSLLGMTVAPFLLGSGVFVALYAACGGIGRPLGWVARPWVWIGRHSYSLFLLHQPMILFLVPRSLEDVSAAAAVLRIAAAMLVTLGGALAMERAVASALEVARSGRAYLMRLALSTAAVGAVVFSLLVAAELAIRSVDPQEVLGWGERASLEPHPRFGWRLKPMRQTRLRWEGYDYQVSANALGFPGPEYPAAKAPGTLRILTTGDAFTSAEGVDTEQAWPRLLEADLAARVPADTKIEVLNFAVTGYGPNQYAVVVEEFTPVYSPDVIVIGFFVNEYDDVVTSDAAFQDSIGFDQPPQDEWRTILRLAHLRRFVGVHLSTFGSEWLLRRPGAHGYFLGQFAALERDGSRRAGAARRLVADALARVKRAADGASARVIVAMIPAPVQVCGPKDLPYYPRGLELADSARFDVDRPQRTTQGIATALGLGYYDLRAALRAAPEGCPYQPRNLHWTGAGHRAVARYLARALVAGGYVIGSQEAH